MLVNLRHECLKDTILEYFIFLIIWGLKINNLTSFLQAFGDKLITDDNVSAIIDVNFRGLVLSTRLAVENMKKNNVDGHIININRYFNIVYFLL